MTAHPLDPLTADEFRAAAAILRRDRGVDERWRFASIELREPAKDVVRAFTSGDPIRREARVTCWSRDEGTPYKALVSLTDDAVLSWEAVPGEQANMTLDEWHEAHEALIKEPAVIEALAKRGITDLDLVLIDTWAYGHSLIPEDFAGPPGRLDRRLAALHPARQPLRQPGHGPALRRRHEHDGAAADRGHPAAGSAPPSWASTCPHWCPACSSAPTSRPLEITQPEGVSFTLDGNELRWQNWTMRLGFNHREGLVIHRVGYQDGDELRPIAHRLSFAEMVVPYRDPSPDHHRRTAFDIGEWGLGFMTTSLELAATASARSPTSTPSCTTARASRPRSRTPSACTRRTTACCGSTSTRRPARRSAGRGGWWSRSTRRWPTTSTSSTGASTRTARSSARSAPPGSWSPARSTALPRRTARSSTSAPTRRSTSTSSSPAWTSRSTGRRTRSSSPRARRCRSPRTTPTAWPWCSAAGRCCTESEGRQDVDFASQRSWKVVNRNRLNRLGTPTGYKLVPSGALPGTGRPGRGLPAARGGHRPHALGHAVRRGRALAGRRVLQPEPGRHRAAGVDEGRPADRRHRPRAVARVRHPPHHPARGLAGHAGGRRLLLAQAGRVLRPQPRARRAAGAVDVPHRRPPATERSPLAAVPALRRPPRWDPAAGHGRRVPHA